VKRKINGKLRRVKVVKTLVRFSSTVTEGTGAPAAVRVTTTAGGKRVGAASGSFVLVSGKSAVVTATAAIDSDSGSIATGQPPAAGDLFFHDLGSTACVPTALFGGLPCIGATLGGTTLKATTKVTGYR